MAQCKLCGTEGQVTKHHLIPKSVTKKVNSEYPITEAVVKLCDECHRAIHQQLIDHIFLEKKFSPHNKVDYLKLHMLKDYLKNKHPATWLAFRNHWKSYLKNELRFIEETEE